VVSALKSCDRGDTLRMSSRLARWGAILCLVAASLPAAAYKQATHVQMTNAAIKASSLSGKPAAWWNDLANPAGSTVAQAARLAAQAANDEDVAVRSLFHFQDPQLGNAPLSASATVITPPGLVPPGLPCLVQFAPTIDGVSVSSIFSTLSCNPLTSTLTFSIAADSSNWILSGNTQSAFGMPPTSFQFIDARGHETWDYDQAKSAFLKALVLPLPGDRSANAGIMFQHLGHVLHHLQDMAQPQHVRNDIHCDELDCALISASLYAPSAYEAYVAAMNPLPMSSGDLSTLPRNSAGPIFTMPAQFWVNGGLGIAEFTSDNFVSIGTNFQVGGPNGWTTDGQHVLPAPPLPSSRYIASPPACTGSITQPSFRNRTYYALGVHDLVQGTVTPITGTLTGQSFLGLGSLEFTLDCYTYQSAAYILVPQAITYSAWFTNFMFRGSITSTVTASSWQITNNSTSETLSGVANVYADDAQGTRSPGLSCSVSLGPGATASCPFSGQSPPLGALVVFNGLIGTEPGQVAFVRTTQGGGGGGCVPTPIHPCGPVPPPTAIHQTLATNGSVACVILRDSSVTCWGYGPYGELGNGLTTTGSATPLPVPGLSGAVQIAVNGAHVCALLSTGGIACWGNNSAGQLGDGTTTSNGMPVMVMGISNAKAISLGGNHSCALLGDGSVSCWGTNGSGQLGQPASVPYELTPTSVPGLSGVINISAGGQYTCAVLAVGSVQCFGADIDGEVGNVNGPVGPNYVYSPTPASGVTTAVSVQAQSANTCAVLTDGTVSCWGNNQFDELGRIATNRANTPGLVTGLSGVQSIAPGSTLDHVCVIMIDATMRCWGANSQGQLGNGSPTSTLSPTPVSVSGISTAVAAATAGSTSCAVLQDGTVRCWGYSGSSTPGVGVNSYTPVAVPGISNAE